MKFYFCDSCKSLVEMVVDHGVTPVCCGKPMTELVAGTTDAAVEKHIPDAHVENGKLVVKVGSVEHPMLEEHFIQFIAVKAGSYVFRKNLVAGEAPYAEFDLNGYTGNVEIYEHCNLHGLWKTELTV